MTLRDSDGKWLTGALAKASSEEDYALIMSTVPATKDATSLAAFGYQYYKDEAKGKTVLRTIKDPSKGFQWLGQKHYDILGNAIVNDIYDQLGSKYGLEKVMVPLSAEKESTMEPSSARRNKHVAAPQETATEVVAEQKESVTEVAAAAAAVQKESATEANAVEHLTDEEADAKAVDETSAAAVSSKRPTRPGPQVPIFVSENANTADTLLLVMQGSGAVRPGMWARALCTNESLEAGSIYSYLDKAKERGWGIIVTNPNENSVPNPDIGAASDDGKSAVDAYWLGTTDAEWKPFARKVAASAERVKGSESPQEHSQYVYSTFVLTSQAKKVFIVAHSFGGMCTGALFRNATIRAHLLTKCVAVAFTDAINDIKPSDPSEVKDFYKKKLINWVASRRKLNASEGTHRYTGSEERSAGHDTHEWTSACCVDPVFEWFDHINK